MSRKDRFFVRLSIVMSDDGIVSAAVISDDEFDLMRRAQAKLLELSRDLKVSLRRRTPAEWQALMPSAIGLAKNSSRPPAIRRPPPPRRRGR